MRNRTLAEIQNRLERGSRVLEDAIDGLLAKARSGRDMATDPLQVLELGFGEGRALLELAVRYRDRPVVFHGVDRAVKGPVTERAHLARTAREYDLIPENEIDGFDWPRVEFYTLGIGRDRETDKGRSSGLRLPDDRIDLVYSAVTFRFVRDKLGLLEEVIRVLRPGGHAVLQMAPFAWDYAEGPVAPAPRISPIPCFIVLRRGDRLVPVSAHLARAIGPACTLRFLDGAGCVIHVEKHAPGRVDLGVRLCAEATLKFEQVAREFGLRDDEVGVGGLRSVYDVVGPGAPASGGAT